jgi:hypothetical protein
LDKLVKIHIFCKNSLQYTCLFPESENRFQGLVMRVIDFSYRKTPLLFQWKFKNLFILKKSVFVDDRENMRANVRKLGICLSPWFLTWKINIHTVKQFFGYYIHGDPWIPMSLFFTVLTLFIFFSFSSYVFLLLTFRFVYDLRNSFFFFLPLCWNIGFLGKFHSMRSDLSLNLRFIWLS